VAAGLLTGANAWAEATVIYERGTTNAWTEADLTDWTSLYCTPVIDGGIKVSSTNAGWTNTKTISLTENSIVTLTASLHTGGAPGNGGSYDYLQIGGVSARFNEQSAVASVDIDGTPTNLSLTYNRTTDYDITITINQATGAVSYTIGGVSGTATSNTAITDVVFGHNRGGREGYGISTVLKKISVSEEKQTVTTADYTINYIYNEETIKTVNGTSVVGAGINAETSITIDGQKYFAADGATTSMQIAAGENTLNVELRQAETYAYTVNAVDGSDNILKEITKGSTVEGEAAAAFGYPQYLKVGDVLYEANKSLTSGGYYKYVGYTPTTDNAILNITYTATDISTLWFSEGEDIDGASANSASNTDIRCSMAAGAQFGSAINVVTLPAGSYNLTAQIWGNKGESFTFMAGTTQIGVGGEQPTFSTNGTLHTNSAEFTLTETTTITVQGGANGKVIDWIYITGAPSSDVEIIGALGFSTGYRSAFSSDIVVANNSAKKVTFKNHGSGTDTEYYKNWVLDINYGGSLATTLRSDWYAFDKGQLVYPYTFSTDGGATLGTGNVWANWFTDNAESDVELTLSNVNGKLYVIGTMTKDNDVYYVNYVYGDGTQTDDFTLNLSVDHSWIEIESIEDAETTTTFVHPVAVTTTLDAAGWATYANNVYAIDAANATGGTAYAAAADAAKLSVKLNELNVAVPANTGIVLNGEKNGIVTLPIADAAEAVSTGLEVNVDGTTFTAESGYTYFGMKKNADKLTFATFDPSTVAIPANKAYLKVLTSSLPKDESPARLTVTFDDDETTGISTVAAQGEQSETIFNLQGQRVSQAQKGLYIVNGKKVIKK